jgi:hypothetical protein
LASRRNPQWFGVFEENELENFNGENAAAEASASARSGRYDFPKPRQVKCSRTLIVFRFQYEMTLARNHVLGVITVENGQTTTRRCGMEVYLQGVEENLHGGRPRTCGHVPFEHAVQSTRQVENLNRRLP